ncbi:MAG: ATP-binding cassette domain-containing protein [Spiroplasma sp.]|nr:ATP-binding cassette domain-containing protein [Spiroplasma sp.]
MKQMMVKNQKNLNQIKSQQQGQPIIKLQNLTKSYDKIQKLLFYEVNLTINNEIYAIIGPNGSGKTVLMRMLAGLEKSSKGEILILDASGFYDKLKKPSNMRDFNIVYVSQDDDFDENLTVKQTIILGFEKSRAYFFTNLKESEFKITELMEKYQIKLNLDKFVRDLSIEEKKKLALLWALFKQPKVLLLDEPTAGLSLHQKLDFWLTFKCLREQKFTIVFTTKDQEFATAVADRISWIKKVKITNPKLNQPKNNIKSFRENSRKDLINYQKPKIKNEVPLLYVSNFSLNDDILPSFFNLEFAVRPGEIYGIYDYENLYGEVLTNSLVGLIKNVVRRIWFEEKEVTFYKPKKFAKLNINSLPAQYDKNAVLKNDNLFMNFLLWNYNKKNYVTKTGVIKKFDVKNKVIDLTKKYKIPDSEAGLGIANHLSKGELQRFAFARILEDQPKLLVLANPFANLDDNSTKLIIKQLQKLLNKGNAVLIIDNDPFILELLCQRVAVLYHKEFVAKMVGNQVKANHLINSSVWADYPLENETFIKSDKMHKFSETKWFVWKHGIKRVLLFIFKPLIIVRKSIKKMIDKIKSRVV